MALLKIRLLGNPEVAFDDQSLIFPTQKTLALLIYLVVEKGMFSRDSLMTLLWPEHSTEKANVTFRSTLSRLRRTLKPAGVYIISEGRKVGFDFDKIHDLDLDWLATAVHPETSPDELSPILAMDRGEFLQGFFLPDAPEFDTWSAIQRESCQRQLETVYDRFSQHLLAIHNHAAAVETAASWVARAPLSEQAYRRLMAAQALNGQRQAALQTYERLQTTLQQELDMEPSRESVVLAEHIGRGSLGSGEHPGLSTMVGSAPTRDPGQPFPLPLVGRADEHNRLVTAFHQTKNAETQVLALIGMAGVGKTRLVSAFQEWVLLDSPEAEVWQGRAFETGGRLAYQPVFEALRARLDKVNAPDDLLEDVWLAELSQLIPELRARYPDLPPPLTGDAHFVRARLFEAVANLGIALTARHPAVFVLEDMQWADADTLDLVHYLVRRWVETGAPILVLLVIRQEAYAADARLREWLTNLGRDATLKRLLLDSLNGLAVENLVNRLAGENVDDTSTAFAAWLWAETRGLPFFIEALLQMLVEQDVLPVAYEDQPVYDFAMALNHVRSVAQVPMPPGVREVIQARLGQQSKEAGSLLLAAAVLSRASTFERLCRVADLHETEALEALEALLDGRLLLEQSSDRRPYAVAHDYIREVVYTESREARRRVFHRRALLALEAADAPAAECAYHALASLLDEPALRYSLAAGDEALAKYALEESLVHYDRARDVSRSMAAGEVSSEILLRLYQNRGRAFELGQQDVAARDNYQEMQTLAEARNDLSLKLAALVAQCIVHVTGLSVFNPSRARELSSAALDLARRLEDRAAKARTMWCMMLVEHFSGGENHKVLAFGNEALAIAQELGLKELTGYVQTNLAWAYFNAAQLNEAHKANDEARAIWQSLGNLPMVADSYTIKLHMYRNTGEYDALLALEHEALHASRVIKNVLHEGMALFNICDAYCAQGQYGQAMTTLEAAKTLAAAASEIPNSDLGIYLYSIHIFLSVGALEKADQLADSLYALKEAFQPVVRTFFLVAVARAKIAVGKVREAEDILVRDLDVPGQDSPIMIDMAPVFVTYAHLQLALGHPEHALELLEAVIRRLQQVGSRNCLAEAYLLQSEARLALGEMTQARENLREAKAVAEATRERPILWQILASLSEIERRSGNEAETEMLRLQACEIIQYIADHAGDEQDLRASFLAQPEVVRILTRTNKKIAN
jgi:DNA-binding SARP family transcriptional activator/tetratricopeptide (TPR) repeat protein